MIKTLTLLAVLASPVQAAELPECRDVANNFIDQMQAQGMVYVNISPMENGIFINFKSKGGLHKVTLLVTVAKNAFSPKEGSQITREGSCNLDGVEAYWDVAESHDEQSRAGL